MDRSRIDALAALAGLSLPDDVDVEIVGGDPLYPSPHHLGDGASFARLLTGIAANELCRARGRPPQRLWVDARHAAASLLSFLHLSFADESRRPAATRAMRHPQVYGIHPTRDGRFIQLHGSFNDGPFVLDELGLDESASADDVVSAVAERDAFELEEALIARRLCGGVVMSRDEWAAHPQGAAIADLPVVSIARVGDAPVEPRPAGDRPASGVRVLDLTRVLAGPTSSKTLAEHGADVLHISTPDLESGVLFEVETGIGKRQAHLDLTKPDEAAALRALAAECDVFVQGYRLGALAGHGLGPGDLAALRPGIVYVSLNCYGHVGPWAERPGWEQLAQAATGMSMREGADTGVPRLAPGAVNDYTTGYFAAYGAMVALARRATEGGSWLVEVSLSQTSTWYQRMGDDNDAEEAAAIDVSPFLVDLDSPDYGPLRALAPALSMSETPPRWDLPPVRHGTHAPVWMPR